jgi:hypothetical protein
VFTVREFSELDFTASFALHFLLVDTFLVTCFSELVRLCRGSLVPDVFGITGLLASLR